MGHFGFDVLFKYLLLFTEHQSVSMDLLHREKDLKTPRKIQDIHLLGGG